MLCSQHGINRITLPLRQWWFQPPSLLHSKINNLNKGGYPKGSVVGIGTSLTSLKDEELANFASISETWWDAEGPFTPLHAMSPTRLAFVHSTLCRQFGRDPLSPRPLVGLRVADIGCGGGILSEPLARMGATVTGVDAVDNNIKIARIHAVLHV